MNIAPPADCLKLRGYLEFCLRDARTGRIVKRGKQKNVVTATGRGWALERLMSSSNANILTAIAIGSVSATAPTSNDTTMNGYMTIKTIGSQTLSTASNAACTYQAAISFASNQTWSGSNQIGEFGLYNATTTNGASAILFNHLTTSAYINFGSTNTLAITITITN